MALKWKVLIKTTNKAKYYSLRQEELFLYLKSKNMRERELCRKLTLWK